MLSEFHPHQLHPWLLPGPICWSGTKKCARRSPHHHLHCIIYTIRLSQLHTSRISFPLLAQVELALPLAVQDDVFHVLCHYGAPGLPDSWWHPFDEAPLFRAAIWGWDSEGIQNCTLQITAAVIDAVQSYEFWGCCRHMKDVVSQNMGFICAGLCYTACHGPEPASRHSLVFRFLCPPAKTIMTWSISQLLISVFVLFSLLLLCSNCARALSIQNHQFYMSIYCTYLSFLLCFNCI